MRTRSEATHGPSGGGDSVAGLRKSEGPTAGPARRRAPLGGEGPSTPGSSPGPGPSSSRPPRTGSACQNRRRRGSEAGVRPTRCRAPAGGSSGGLVPTSQAPGPPRLFSVPELGRQGLGRPASAGDRSCVPARTLPGHRRSQPERGPGLAGRWLDSLRPVGLGVAGGHPGTPLGSRLSHGKLSPAPQWARRPRVLRAGQDGPQTRAPGAENGAFVDATTSPSQPVPSKSLIPARSCRPTPGLCGENEAGPSDPPGGCAGSGGHAVSSWPAPGREPLGGGSVRGLWWGTLWTVGRGLGLRVRVAVLAEGAGEARRGSARGLPRPPRCPLPTPAGHCSLGRGALVSSLRGFSSVLLCPRVSRGPR